MEFLTEWSSRDRTLALALDRLDGELIGPNGYPRSLEEDPDTDGYWTPTAVVNYASKAGETWMRDNAAKAEPGTRLRVDYSRPNEEDWK